MGIDGALDYEGATVHLLAVPLRQRSRCRAKIFIGHFHANASRSGCDPINFSIDPSLFA